MQEQVVQVGEQVLRLKAKPVAKKDFGSKKISGVIKRMKQVLAKEKYGVAIAAPQIGESLRIFVVAGRAFVPQQKDGKETPLPPDKVFINPKLIRLSKSKKEMSEGCLSVRHKYGMVLRHEKAALSAQDENGKAFTYNGSGLVGHIFQHECDHLDGILYIDKAVMLEADEDFKKLKEKRAKDAD